MCWLRNELVIRTERTTYRVSGTLIHEYEKIGLEGFSAKATQWIKKDFDRSRFQKIGKQV